MTSLLAPWSNLDKREMVVSFLRTDPVREVMYYRPLSMIIAVFSAPCRIEAVYPPGSDSPLYAGVTGSRTFHIRGGALLGSDRGPLCSTPSIGCVMLGEASGDE